MPANQNTIVKLIAIAGATPGSACRGHDALEARSGLAEAHPLKAGQSRVIVGPRSALQTAEIVLRNFNWLGGEEPAPGALGRAGNGVDVFARILAEIGRAEDDPVAVRARVFGSGEGHGKLADPRAKAPIEGARLGPAVIMAEHRRGMGAAERGDVELLEELEADDSELAKMAQEASVVKLVNEILVEAANERRQ